MTLEQQDLAATTVEGEANQIRREIEAMQQVADALVPLSYKAAEDVLYRAGVI